jgi:hypothetical protein
MSESTNKISDWDIFNKYSADSYKDSVKKRFKDIVLEYTSEDDLLDKLSKHLKDILMEEYYYYFDKANQIKSVAKVLFPEIP